MSYTCSMSGQTLVVYQYTRLLYVNVLVRDEIDASKPNCGVSERPRPLGWSGSAGKKERMRTVQLRGVTDVRLASTASLSSALRKRKLHSLHPRSPPCGLHSFLAASASSSPT